MSKKAQKLRSDASKRASTQLRPDHSEYNFEAVRDETIAAACCFYEYAWESAEIRSVVDRLRATQNANPEANPVIEIEYREPGDSRRAECSIKFQVEEEITVAEVRFPLPRRADPEAFAAALLQLSKVEGFPQSHWLRLRSYKEARQLAQALAHETFSKPPAMMMMRAKSDAQRLSSFLLEVGEHFPATGEYGTPIYGFFRLDLQGDESEIKEAVTKFLERQRTKEGVGRRNKGGVSLPKTRLKQLGALRLRDPRWKLTQEKAAELLGYYADRTEYGQACTAALTYFIEYFALSDTEKPVHFSDRFRGQRG